MNTLTGIRMDFSNLKNKARFTKDVLKKAWKEGVQEEFGTDTYREGVKKCFSNIKEEEVQS